MFANSAKPFIELHEPRAATAHALVCGRTTAVTTASKRAGTFPPKATFRAKSGSTVNNTATDSTDGLWNNASVDDWRIKKMCTTSTETSKTTELKTSGSCCMANTAATTTDNATTINAAMLEALRAIVTAMQAASVPRGALTACMAYGRAWTTAEDIINQIDGWTE